MVAHVDQVRVFGRYNAWANARIGASVAALDENDYHADCGLFFRSIHGTLNHVLVGDRLWFHRITGEIDGNLPERLDETLHDDRAGLLEARSREDARIIGFVEALEPTQLADHVRYRNMAGESFSQPLGLLMAHVFNHQTHHRGHVHAALTGLGVDAPSLDLIYYLRELG